MKCTNRSLAIRRTGSLIPAIVMAALGMTSAFGQARKQPIYVGARACGTCHEGSAIGNQYSLWLHTTHSSSWAALAKPEARKIATLSGIRQEPQESPICLGCHATAYRAEPWQKDDDFHLEEGVQCEACHGPGSEYMDAAVMRDRNAAMKAGLVMPAKADCMTCHIEKGSHVAVLKMPQIDIDKAWKQIAHPLAAKREPSSIPSPSSPEIKRKPGPKYAGSAACGSCHKGLGFGHQYSVWRLSPHARAYASLSTLHAKGIADKDGVKGDPQKAPECLKCHTMGAETGPDGRLASFWPDEGVGCEACHGPGSEYMADAIMRDKRSAETNGLKPVARETCLKCHSSNHDKFDYEKALPKITHPTKPVVASEPRYKTPLRLALRPDGKELWVTCEAADSVIIVDPVKKQKVAELAAGGLPTDVTFTPDGSRAFVSSRLDDTVSMFDVASRKLVKTVKVGNEPHGVRTDKQGKYLYVLNTSQDDIWVFEAQSLKWVKKLQASRSPWAMALSPDGGRMLVTNSLSRFTPLRTPPISEVTAIDTKSGTVEDRWTLPGVNLMMGVAWHPSGEFALTTINRTKNLVPMTRLMQGWTITNGLGILWKDGRVDQVLLGDPGQSFPDATDVAITPDGRYALVTSSSTDFVAVVDIQKMMHVVKSASQYEREHVLPNHLGKTVEFVASHIEVKNSPRGLTITPDGRTAFVANALDDSLSAIDLRTMKVTDRIDLGGPKEITRVRYGERLFNSAKISFRRQMSCHTCHPDGHVDGVTYDIEADGIGISPVDNRTLRGILDTAPFKWEGTNPSLSRQCGARLAAFFTRLLPFNPEELAAVDNYVTTIPRPPNRYHTPGTDYTPAQRRGRVIFDRTTANDGHVIPVENRCITCHNAPYFTDRKRHDVGTKMPFDRTGNFDVPHLNNIYDSAPYLHNGMAATLEEIWTVYNPYDQHGATNDMTKDQLNDLIEYLKTL